MTTQISVKQSSTYNKRRVVTSALPIFATTKKHELSYNTPGSKDNAQRTAILAATCPHHFHAMVAQLRAVAHFQVGETGLESLEPLTGRHELCSPNAVHVLPIKSGKKQTNTHKHT